MDNWNAEWKSEWNDSILVIHNEQNEALGLIDLFKVMHLMKRKSIRDEKGSIKENKNRLKNCEW